MTRKFIASLALGWALATTAGAEALYPAAQRFSAKDVQETPDFQRHVVPLMGRLGCNGRACHGSFQGQGGFRLSLFGYDFKSDHTALAEGDSPRINIAAPAASKILEKPTLEVPHKGGKKLEANSWEYNMLSRWVAGGGKSTTTPLRLEKLVVEPTEILFSEAGQLKPLRVTAHWANGEVEDVTCLSRFRTNNEAVAEVDAEGRIKSVGKGDTHIVAFYDNGVAVSQVLSPVSGKVGVHYPAVPAPTKIDQLIIAKLQKLGVVPSELATDAEFLRRASLDATGTLPTPAEIEAFLADSSPDKRSKKIDELLERPTHAAWWATILCDVTGASPRSFAAPQFRQFVDAWYTWIHDRVQRNVSYKEIVSGIVLATSRQSGQTYDDYMKEMAEYFRKENPKPFSNRATMPFYWMRPDNIKPELTAEKFAHTFLGLRLECAQCHKHPYDQWTQQDYQQFMAFFTPVKYGVAPDGRARSTAMNAAFKDLKGKDRVDRQLAMIRKGEPYPFPELYVTDPPKPTVKPVAKGQPSKGKAPKVAKQPQKATVRAATPKLLGGEEVTLESKVDPRKPLMDWLAEKDNPYFAAAFVNRVWAQYFGAGIIDPPDDQNLANPPSNPALLDYLTNAFIEHNYDMKWLHKEICNSRAYQLSWRPNETNVNDARNFSRALVRRLPAEISYDAIVRATTADAATLDDPAQIAKRAISANAAGGNAGAFALTVFGKPTRAVTCDCERSNEPSLSQSIYLQNDQDVLQLLRRKTSWLIYLKESGQLQGEKVVEHSAEVSKLKERIAVLKQKKNNQPEIDRLKKRLARLEQILANPVVDESKGDASQSKAATKRLHESIVREAFLRTVSRPPTRAEIDRGVKQITSGKSSLEGLEDLMWALLNTKEFIVNH